MYSRQLSRVLLAVFLFLMALSGCSQNPRLDSTNTAQDATPSAAGKSITPVSKWRTQRFRIRIDQLSNGKYRLASWSIYSNPNNQPDLVLENGVVTKSVKDGSHDYTFHNKDYKYVFRVHSKKTQGLRPGELIVYEKGTMFLHELGVEVK